LNRRLPSLYATFAAITLVAAAATPVSAAPERTGVGGPTGSALLTLIVSVGDDLFSTTDLTSLVDPTGKSTQHYGPYMSGSTDSGTCGNDWANDTFNRHFTVQRNVDGTFTVIEQFKDGSFVTPASTSTQPRFSPGGCQPSAPPKGTVKDGVTGSLHGYFVIPLPPGETQSSTDPSCVAGSPTTPCTTTGFIDSHFMPACYLEGSGTCPVTTFFFHYSAGDQSLIQHEWRNASADRGGNSGDIRSANI
jgi:hypothetical protein